MANNIRTFSSTYLTDLLLGDHDCFYPAHSSYPSYHLSHRRRQRRRQHLHRHPFPGQALIRFVRRLNDANGRDCERLSNDDLVEAVADVVAAAVAVAVAAAVAAAAVAVLIFIKRPKLAQGFKKFRLKKLPSYRMSSTSIAMNLSMTCKHIVKFARMDTISITIN
uniref:Uncharacterized protein n=1 Tax=Glossina austeni TaxID=7395 RepID=A0A1A9UCS5_GLOAU